MSVRLNIADQRVMLGPNTDEPRILHTMILTKDIEASVRFYCGVLGMRVLTDPIESDNSRVSARFVGFEGADTGGGMIELVQPWDDCEEYHHGLGATHIAIGVPDADEIVAKIESLGLEVDRRGKAAFASDPNGYVLEIVQTFR